MQKRRREVAEQMLGRIREVSCIVRNDPRSIWGESAPHAPTRRKGGGTVTSARRVAGEEAGEAADDMDEDKEFDEETAEETGAKELSQLTRLYGSDKLKGHLEKMNVRALRAAQGPGGRIARGGRLFKLFSRASSA